MARQKFDKGVTLIAPHTEVVGDINFSDQLYVAGKVSGNVVASSDKATLGGQRGRLCCRRGARAEYHHKWPD